MTTAFYVVFDQSGFAGAFKSDKFELRPGQYATRIELNVPDEVFAPVNYPRVVIDVPADALRRTISATVEEGE